MKNKVSLDELDLKLLNELPLISEVLTSSSNRIKRLFEPIMLDLSEVCVKNIPKGWGIEKRKKENVFYPFSSDYGKDTITELENHFSIQNDITFVKKSGTKWLNYFSVLLGLWWDQDDENNKPYFYFQIYTEPTERFQGTMQSLDFYNRASGRIKGFKCSFKHPEKGMEEEEFAIHLEIEHFNKLGEAYVLFKNELLIPYLQNVSKR